MSYRENHGFSIFDVDSLEGKQQIYVVIYVVICGEPKDGTGSQIAGVN